MTGSLVGFSTAAGSSGYTTAGITSGAFVNDTFTGSGTVTAQFEADPILPLGSVFDPKSVIFQFQSTPPVTPEPTTFLLFATGLGMFWRRLRA